MANYLLTHTGAQIEEAVSLALAGVQDGSVTTPKLADGAVTEIKLADGAVTAAKLSTGHPTWDTGGTLSATAFSGPLTGNVTGNLSGNATTATTATKFSTTTGSAPVYAARAWVSWEGSIGYIS